MSNSKQIDAIMGVMEAAFDPQWGEAWNRRQVEDALLLPNTFAIVSHDDLKLDPSGFVITRHAPGEEELLLVAVRPEYRRKGVGEALIKKLARNARERGAQRIFLEMRENNPAAHLYSKIGFEPIGRRKSYYLMSDGNRLDAITYGLSL